MKKLFERNTFFIVDGDTLERVKDHFERIGESSIWGYDTTYDEDDAVSSGYLHYDKGFYLSKEAFEKPTLSIYDLFGGYFKESLPDLSNPLILEPQDMDEKQWRFLCQLFTKTEPSVTQRVVISLERGLEYFLGREEIEYAEERKDFYEVDNKLSEQEEQFLKEYITLKEREVKRANFLHKINGGFCNIEFQSCTEKTITLSVLYGSSSDAGRHVNEDKIVLYRKTLIEIV